MSSAPSPLRPLPNNVRETADHALDGEAASVVEDEATIAANVARRLAEKLADPTDGVVQKSRTDFNTDLVSLRDQIREARHEDVPALLTEMMRLAAVQNVDAPEARGRVDPQKPYFGHLRLSETILKKRGRAEQVVRDVLIGKQSLVDRAAGIVIVDWRDAPVSRLYYRYAEGDDYEERFGDETREGEIAARRTLTFDAGDLVRIKDDKHILIKKKQGDDDSTWVALPALAPRDLAGGAGTATRVPPAHMRPTRGPAALGHEGPDHTRADKHLPEIAALIDAKQFDAMTGPEGGVVILQGGAGSGKTTVALHRLAYLSYNAPKRFRPSRMLFVVRQPALVRYVERVLPSLDVAEVKVRAYTAWALAALRWCVKGQLPELSKNSPVEVARLKKHPALFAAIEQQAARRFTEARMALHARVHDQPDGDDVLALFDAAQPAPLVLRLQRTRQRILARRLHSATKERALKVLQQCERTASDLLTEWSELITDAELLAGVCKDVDEAVGLSDAEFRRALEWTTLQVDDPDPDEIDEEKKRPVDGEREDLGPRQKLDEHDLPVVLLMCIARFGCIRSRQDDRAYRFDHIAVDEAQDLAAIELAPLLNCAEPHNSVTLAGDVVQKVVFDNGFSRWAQLLNQLGIAAREVEPLRLTYRSAAPIVQFAHEALGPLAPKTPPQAARDGQEVEAFGFDETGEEVAFLARHLRSVMSREPRASVALLCRYKERASFLYDMLKDADVPHLRLVLHDDFRFTPGIDVADIAGAKGLEYDYVIVPEASAAMFPSDDVARHLLHIGATRAAFQLWLTYSQTPSPLIPASYLRTVL